MLRLDWATITTVNSLSVIIAENDMRVLFTQQEIAERVGASQPMIHYVLNGDRNPSPAMAESLEEVTGICAPAWIWPDRCWNPYIPFADPVQCGSCEHRTKRYPIIHELCLKAVAEQPNYDGLERCLEIIRVINNWPKSFYYGFRERRNDGGWYQITGMDTTVKRPEEVITAETFPYLYGRIEQGKPNVHPYIQYDLYEWEGVSEFEHKYITQLGMKSAYHFPYKNLLLIVTSFEQPLVVGDIGVKYGMEFVQEVHHILNSSTD